MLLIDIKKELENRQDRSAWNKGVTQYALELIEELQESEKYNNEIMDFVGSPADKKAMLNGAMNWSDYSWGGCSYIYNADIAQRLCSPSGLNRCNGGNWQPNRQEQWLDVQARALAQASNRIVRIAKANI